MDQKNAAPGHIGKLFLREDSKPFKETAFARIYKCSKRDGTVIVEKCVRKSAYKNIENELESFKRITRGAHPPDNVIQYYDSDKPDEDSDISFYMELCDGTIDEYWSMEDGSKKYKTTLLELCEQAATGIYNLHMECNMIHRDIKPKNFLIREDGCDLVVKVSDFGLSKVLDLGQSSAPTTSHSTVTYMAPEHHPVDNQNSTSWKKSADIFSLGVLFFNIFTSGKHPFGKTYAKQLSNIEDEKPPSFEVFLECFGFPTEEHKVLAFILIKSMLQVDPTKRPSIEEVFNHPLFWNSDEKINFYWTADDFLRDERKKSKKFETTVKFFDSALVTFDIDDKEKKEFEIKLENIPTPLKEEKKKFSISKCEDIFDLVKIIRDMDAHINEKKKISKEVLGYSGIGHCNYDTFLDSLVGPYPHLLAHLFELLKRNNIKLPSRKSWVMALWENCRTTIHKL
ncbi:serine/threonine-protein kinase/endoribonuclease IRE1-like isoform X1 [Clavelina lepadiformis]|uniref:serine/threonine-protein kinase/endoribonuclease IRE1-like isoform X1 n=1 Tax=Clavelina lepadiformis TaxID=159417 RepID=UPI0040413121